MGWRERMRPASFRGVPFGVSGDDKESGRRTVLHEFPQRDDVYVEDLGFIPGRFAVQAFVLGDDYMNRRDALEAALAKSGPGTLVHPWYGELEVSQTAPYRVRHSALDGGMAVFTLSFAVDGGALGPAPSLNAQVAALADAKAFGNIAVGAFDKVFKIAGQSPFAVEQAFQSVTRAMSRTQRLMSGSLTEIVTIAGVATGYDLLTWQSVGRGIWGTMQSMGPASGKSESALAASYLALAAEDAPTAMAENAGSERGLVAANDAAVNSLTRHLALCEACRSLSLAKPSSQAEARTLREALVDSSDAVLWAEAGQGAPGSASNSAAEPISGNLYQASVTARASALTALAESAKSSPQVITYTPPSVLPSLVLCYMVTGSIALEPDLVARNGIAHSGFIPPEPLEVLKERGA